MLYNLSRLSPAIRAQIENNPRLVRLFSSFPNSMLTVGLDAKTVKGEKIGYLTGIMYLAPHNYSGENVCAMAMVAQCDLACLFTAGRGGMSNVFFARLRKALFWQQHNALAVELIKKDIAKLEKTAAKKGLVPLVRLNGTSDIRFENYGIIQAFPHVQFYDYTKLNNRRNVPANYDLTFSYSGVAAFQPFVQSAIAKGNRIAVVFRSKELVEALIASNATFMGLPIVSGDNSDVRHDDPMCVVVALYAKGKAKIDGTGFVVDSSHPAIGYSLAVAA